MKRLLLLAGLIAIAGNPSGYAGEATSCDKSPRQVVEAFGELFYSQLKVKEAFEAWVREDYIQHNPVAPDGRQAAIDALGGWLETQPGFTYDVKRIIADGDLVAVHMHARPTPEDRGFAVVDIFRVEGCKIAEHWDVLQPVPETSANDNTMF
ncbi:nuclear transport factor 2 family protein [Emcibacter sp.]|uniref:nuclear transport factor 2 family protein n=1 Tax=Emcibacter sp. TaxID=1979954 RepID=UPI002AA948BC|nr:nuclear transport factor 2 family protein [Emcibacter sp.]